MTDMQNTEMNGNRLSSLPFFLGGLGTGIALTLLLAPLTGAATRNLIGRKVKDGEDWVADKAATAKDYVLTQAAELRDRARDVAEVIGREAEAPLSSRAARL